MNRVLAMLAVLLPLCGCWTGVPWFTASDAVNVIPDGRYRMKALDEPLDDGEIVRITRQSDESLQLVGAEGPLNAIVVPLDGSALDHQYIVQVRGQALGARDGKALFLLLDNRYGRYRVSVLPCTRDVAEVVRRSGGSVSRSPQSAAICEFKERETLITRLRLQAQEEARSVIEMTRID